MIYKFISILLLSVSLFSAQLEHVNIGNQDFAFITERYDVYDSKGEILRVYKEERNNNLTFVCSLILKDRTGGCSDQSMEDGSYDINGTTLTLYSFWNRKGKAYDAPYGARIQVYQLQEDYNLKRISSQLYIETERQNYNPESGMQFLFSAPDNEREKDELKRYIDTVEHKYKGTFVFDKQAKELIHKVENALQRKAKNRWISSSK